MMHWRTWKKKTCNVPKKIGGCGSGEGRGGAEEQVHGEVRLLVTLS